MIFNFPRAHKCLLLIAAVTAVFLFVAATVQAQDPSPKWKFQSGDEFDVILSQTTRIQSQVDQRVKDVDNQLTLNINWQVKSVADDGTATIEMTIVSAQMKMASMPNGVGQSIDIDTLSEEKKKGAEAELLKQLNPLMGSMVVIECSPLGDIKKTEVPESTLESLRKAPGSMKLRTLLESDGLQDLFGQSLVVLPTDLTENQPWSSKHQLDTGFGEYLATNACVWQGRRSTGDQELADFEFQTSLAPVEGGKSTESKIVEFVGGGSFVFDMGGGHIVSSKSSNKMKTEQPYREKTITTTVATDVEMQIIKK